MDNKKVVSNFIWRLMERIGAQGVSLVVSIVLARLLAPSVYGTIALVNVFLIILQVFVDSGLGTALIQKKHVDQLDYSSVFYFNLLMCILIYASLFFSAPLIAGFYNNPDLVPIVRVVSVTVLFSGVKGIQQSYVSRTMQFKKFFFATLAGTIISALVGIFMAYMGFGVWALIAQNLTNTAIDTLVLWMTVKWRPTWEFSFTRLKGLLSYGWKILLSSLISTIYTNLRQLLIGKYYSTEDLAYYNKGNEFPNKIVPNIETAITSVLLPTVAKQQDDLENVKKITRRAIKTMAFVIWPMMIGLAACGDTLVLFLLTDKWLPCVKFLQLFCIEAAIWPLSAIGNNSVRAIGRSDINLKIQTVVRIFGICVLLVSIKCGSFAIASTAFFVTVFEFCIVLAVNKNLINYRFFEQIKDIVPSVLLSIAMGGVVYFIGMVSFSQLFVLILQIIAGIVTYVVGAYLLRMESLTVLLNILKSVKR